MVSTYTDVVFPNSQPDQPTAIKLNKLRDDLSAAIASIGGYYTDTWRWTTSTTDAAVSGQVGINAASWNAATHLNLSETDASGIDKTITMDRTNVTGNSILVKDAANANNYCEYTITGPGVDMGTWRQYPVSTTTGKFSGVLPKNNANTTLTAYVQGATGGGGGTGDMTKAIYDTNNNGKVDTCDSVPWTSVTGTPTIGDMTRAVYDTNNNGKVDTCDSIPVSTDTNNFAILGSDNLVYVAGRQFNIAPDTPTFTGSGGPNTLGFAFTVSCPAFLKAISFYKASGEISSSHTVALWNGGAASLLVSKTTSGESAGPGWIVVPFNPVYILQSGIIYWAVYTQTQAYAYIDSYFPRTNGPIIASTGVYKLGGGTPDSSINATYGVDITVTAGGPGGDMLKGLYDTNSDNIVDHAALADAAPWTGISGKPATFPPDSTAMLKAIYDANGNNKVDASESADSAPWTGITGKPATFPPSAHGTTHLDNGSDPVPVVTTLRTGLAPTLSGNAATYLNGTGIYTAVSGSVNPGTWTNVTLGTGWTAPTQAQYRIEVNGAVSTVYFRGMIQAAYSAMGTTGFTVPAGAQPSMTRSTVLGGAQATGTPSDVASYVASMSSAGVCTIFFLGAGPFVWADPAQTQQVYLDGLSYSL